MKTSIQSDGTTSSRAVSRLSVRTLSELLDKAAVDAFSEVIASKYGLINTEGRIAQLPDARYNKHYDVVLEAEGKSVHLEIPKGLAQERDLAAGDYVRVTGRLAVKVKWEGAVKMRVDVCQLEFTDSPEETLRKRREVIDLQEVRRLRSKRAPFPFRSRLKVVVISAEKSQVFGDFLDAIAPVASMLDVHQVSASMDSPTEIATAIEGVESDILVLIRGGGSAEGFTVLEDARVVRALGAKPMFRLVGTGHSVHSGILDLVADHAANTPADAGTFIVRQLGAFHALGEQALRDIERLKLEQAATISTARQRDEEVGRLRAEVAAARLKYSKQQANMKKMFWFCGLLVTLLILTFAFKR